MRLAPVAARRFGVEQCLHLVAPALAFVGAADVAQIVQRAEDFGEPLQVVVERGGAALDRARRRRAARAAIDKWRWSSDAFEHRGRAYAPGAAARKPSAAIQPASMRSKAAATISAKTFGGLEARQAPRAAASAPRLSSSLSVRLAGNPARGKAQDDEMARRPARRRRAPPPRGGRRARPARPSRPVSSSTSRSSASLKRLAGLDHAARQGPDAERRPARAARDQHAAVTDDGGADGEKRAVGIGAGVDCVAHRADNASIAAPALWSSAGSCGMRLNPARHVRSGGREPARGRARMFCMCGRYCITSAPEAIRGLFRYRRAAELSAALQCGADPAGADRAHGRGPAPVRAGALGSDPGLGEGSEGFALLINARGESVNDKPAFRNAMKRRRCLFPADGFYEWKTEGGAQAAYFARGQGRRAARLRRPVGNLDRAERRGDGHRRHRHHASQRGRWRRSTTARR